LIVVKLKSATSPATIVLPIVNSIPLLLSISPLFFGIFRINGHDPLRFFVDGIHGIVKHGTPQTTFCVARSGD
jgi:hypothetical protein